MKKSLKIILISICAILVLALVFGGDDADTDTKATETATHIVETPEPAMSKDEFKTTVDGVLDESFVAYNHTTKWDGDTLVIDIWGDGLAMGAFLAASGDADFLSSWNSMKDTTEYMCDTICDAADGNGLNIDVLVNILNETNLDNSLLSIYNGTTIYDAAN